MSHGFFTLPESRVPGAVNSWIRIRDVPGNTRGGLSYLRRDCSTREDRLPSENAKRKLEFLNFGKKRGRPGNGNRDALKINSRSLTTFAKGANGFGMTNRND
jgi:hypothetical protein